MRRVKPRSLLIVLVSLLLLISCAPGASEEPVGNEGKELIGQLKLLADEQAVIDSIKKILTNPNIGKSEGYKTYSDSAFDNLLSTLGTLKVKEIIRNYLKVDKRQNEVTSAFNQAINNATEASLKERLQKKLDAYISSYALKLKKCFSHDNANVVYDAITSGKYVDKAVSEAEALLDELKATGVTATGSAIDATGDVRNVYLQLDDEGRKVIDEIKNIVTNSSIALGKGYKTYTVSQFNDLLGTLGIDKVKQMISGELKRRKLKDNDYARVEGLIDTKVATLSLKEELKKRLKSVLDFINEKLKGYFSASKFIDIPEPDSDAIYQQVANDVYEPVFGSVEKAVQDIINFERIEKDLSPAQREALLYMQVLYIQTHDKSSEFKFKLLLGGLKALEVGEIMDIHVRFMETKKFISDTLDNSLDDKAKERISRLFNNYVEGYDPKLKIFLAGDDSKEIYKKFKKDGESYLMQLNGLKRTALTILTPARKAGSTPSSTTSVDFPATPSAAPSGSTPSSSTPVDFPATPSAAPPGNGAGST
ncbi:hypothetical protein bcCo53_001253 (plasmid) [Borrelia coriaceae]|uniref:Uncharacterized protein n=1 Tax=Borrelia coriaceae ATCC 43381 TaxID=1408429 RepID=W5T1Q9_9SPIR|nr:hypothetical protein [Borrelia coriaceae]AHH11206.1 Hypothetical protein BCO_0005501 [Borrelia coriaceae ATCC 43381]UPA17084.1 hypothetical protein bcCo53_001253 [Borrelia coriaceae]